MKKEDWDHGILPSGYGIVDALTIANSAKLQTEMNKEDWDDDGVPLSEYVTANKAVIYEEPNAGENSGGDVDYYTVHVIKPKRLNNYSAECEDIIEALGMNFAEGNAFKAIWRSCAERTLGKKKVGNNAIRDAEKVIYYGKRMLAQRT